MKSDEGNVASQEQVGPALAEGVAVFQKGEECPKEQKDGQNADADVKILGQSYCQATDDERPAPARFPAVPQGRQSQHQEQAIPNVVEADAAELEMEMGDEQERGRDAPHHTPKQYPAQSIHRHTPARGARQRTGRAGRIA